jgi:hypothetical protein
MEKQHEIIFVLTLKRKSWLLLGQEGPAHDPHSI